MGARGCGSLRALRVTLAVVGAFAATSGVAAAAPGGDVELVAHRGASGEAPENTIAAIREAARQGADWAEIDVVMSKDGVPVLLHDIDLARTTNVEEVYPDRAPWLVEDFTLDELRRLDAGSWFDARYAGEPLPTFREALLAYDRYDLGLWLEIKSPERYPGVEAALAEVLRTTPGGWLTHPRRETFFQATSFNFTSLRAFAEETDHAVPVSGIASTVPDDATLAELATWMEYYIVNYRPLKEGDLVRLRAAGLKTALWTPNDPPTVASLAASGADALIQNYPAVARRTLVGEDPFPGPESVVVQQIVNNPAGDDMQPENGEHVVLRNLSGRTVDLTGWYMRDDPASRLAVGDGYTIPPGGTLRVYVGTGTNTADRYYNALPAAILSNSGDSIALHRPDHRVVHIVGNDLTQ